MCAFETLPEIFRLITRKTLICLFGLVNPHILKWTDKNYIKSIYFDPKLAGNLIISFKYTLYT